MDDPMNEAGTGQDPPPLCNRFSDQIIGMTFGEEKAMLGAAARKKAAGLRPGAAAAERRPAPSADAAMATEAPSTSKAVVTTGATEPAEPADAEADLDADPGD
jgi:hypothetical protein